MFTVYTSICMKKKFAIFSIDTTIDIKNVTGLFVSHNYYQIQLKKKKKKKK